MGAYPSLKPSVMNKEIKMYNPSETLENHSKGHLGSRILSFVFKPFFLGFLCMTFVLILVVEVLDLPSVPKGYVPAYERYGKVIIENYRHGIRVRNDHVFEGVSHAKDCPCHFKGKDSIQDVHVYDNLIEAVRYYKAHPGIEWYVRDALRAAGVKYEL